MRIVWKEDDLDAAFQLARSEAELAFGDPVIYIEKFLENPRHSDVSQITGPMFAGFWGIN
jgi:acetyl-CoA carboxylase biotin carboxylase subunit